MEIAAKAARFGNFILSLIASVIILAMFAYGGYSLWDSYMVNQGAFLSSDLLKYKPQAAEDGWEASVGGQRVGYMNWEQGRREREERHSERWREET